MLQPTPPFTRVMMRGYDPEEVDEHLRSVEELDQAHLQALEAAEARSEALADEVAVLARRVEELEATTRSETPRSIAALGERWTTILSEAEEAAGAMLRSAGVEADALVVGAKHRADELVARASVTLADAQNEATSRVAVADERATAVIDDAEAWARRRRVEVDGWVEETKAYIDAERARAAEDFARVRHQRSSELAELSRQRSTLVDGLEAVGASIARAVGEARATSPAPEIELADDPILLDPPTAEAPSEHPSEHVTTD